MKRTLLFSIATLALGGLLSAPGFAQNPNTQGAGPGIVDPNHPRVNEVNAREGTRSEPRMESVIGGIDNVNAAVRAVGQEVERLRRPTKLEGLSIRHKARTPEKMDP